MSKVINMEKRLKEYLSYMAEFITTDHSGEEYLRAYKDLMTQIAFFQHERLIHLIVTVTFAILTLMGVIAYIMTSMLLLLALTFLFIILLIPYIRHYYILENGVQKLYTYYDSIKVYIPTSNSHYPFT